MEKAVLDRMLTNTHLVVGDYADPAAFTHLAETVAAATLRGWVEPPDPVMPR